MITVLDHKTIGRIRQRCSKCGNNMRNNGDCIENNHYYSCCGGGIAVLDYYPEYEYLEEEQQIGADLSWGGYLSKAIYCFISFH